MDSEHPGRTKFAIFLVYINLFYTGISLHYLFSIENLFLNEIWGIYTHHFFFHFKRKQKQFCYTSMIAQTHITLKYFWYDIFIKLFMVYIEDIDCIENKHDWQIPCIITIATVSIKIIWIYNWRFFSIT